MGQEAENERRRRDLTGYGIDADLLREAGEQALVLHCLPGPLRRGDHRGDRLRPAVGGLRRGREPAAHAEGSPRADRRVVLPLKDNVPTRTFPIVTVGLIAANVIAYVWEVSGAGLERPRRTAGATTRARSRARASVRRSTTRRSSRRLQRDVHARRHLPHRREHALPLDLRQQRRGRARAHAVPGLVSARRRRGDGGADAHHARPRHRTRREHSERRRERCDRRRARRVLRAAAAGARADGDLPRLLLHLSRDSRDHLPRSLDRVAGAGRNAVGHHADGWRRRRVLRAHRRFHLRRAYDPVRQEERAATADVRYPWR